MTREEFLFLQTPEARKMIEENLSVDPVSVAMKTGNPTIATQVKILRRSAKKLPSYYAARCIMPSVSYQQASSEAAALSKNFPEGNLAIDLTCGLGVDSFALSKSFKRVISVEKDPLTADIARYNLSRLGVSNIEVVTAAAEDYCRDYQGQVDLIYIDPSRRDQRGRNVYSLEDSSPDILRLLGRMKEISGKQVIKLSPLFDVGEVFRIFGEECRAEVLSVDGECKEVVARLGSGQGKVLNIIIRNDRIDRYIFDPTDIGKDEVAAENRFHIPQFILVPDVAFYKSRTLGALVESIRLSGSAGAENLYTHGGYIFSSGIVDNFPGNVYEIRESFPYRPKDLAKTLKQKGIRQANIHSRTAGYSPEQLSIALKIRLGGSEELFFAEYAGSRTIFFVRRIS